MPSFGEYFRKDFMGATDLWSHFGGEAQDVVLTIKSFGWRDSLDHENKRQKIPKPVIFFHELDRPVMLNKTSHQALVTLFGDEYDRDPGTTGQRVTLRLYMKAIGNEGPQPCCQITMQRHPNQNRAITQLAVDKFMAKARALDTDLDEFLEWLARHSEAPKPLWNLCATTRDRSAWPFAVLEYMKEFLEETEARRNPPPPAADPVMADDDIPF